MIHPAAARRIDPGPGGRRLLALAGRPSGGASAAAPCWAAPELPLGSGLGRARFDNENRIADQVGDCLTVQRCPDLRWRLTTNAHPLPHANDRLWLRDPIGRKGNSNARSRRNELVTGRQIVTAI